MIGCLVHKFYPILTQPMEDLEKQQCSEENHKLKIEFFSKDRHG